jgi:predicted ATPase
MPLSAVNIKSYRSVRNLWLPVEQLSIFVGANGVGKTNLYKALALLRAAADGTLTRAIAEEGGLNSVLWAGQRVQGKPVRLVLKAVFDELDYGAKAEMPHSYEVQLGIPHPDEAAFGLEPMVKAERLTIHHGRRDVVMMDRNGPLVMLRNDKGERESHDSAVLSSETALAAFRDGARYPELEAIRRELLGWRLYHDFRTDVGSPIRQPCHAITTPTLSSDGHDLAAVLATLSVIRGDTTALDAAIHDAFPGARLRASQEESQCRISLSFPDMPRAFAAHELSDGTLKYLCLLGALMGYRLPPLIALNEPEASLHPSLLAPLARLIASAAGRARIWIVTHSDELAGHLLAETGRPARRVVKTKGATGMEGLKLSGEYADDDDEEDEDE